MTDSNSSLIEVPALLDERRRYEGWLSALEARRESTPKHVFERVHADYRARLTRVAEQLATHRSAIEAERSSVQSRLSSLAADEQLRRDERAELELRAHVGELSGEDAERAFSSVDEVIAQLVGENEGLAARVAELQSLLDEEAARPVVAEPVIEEVAAAEPIAAVAPSAPAPEAVTVPLEPPAPVAAEVPVVEQPVAAEAIQVVSVVAPAGEPRKEERPGAAPARESFDELAFLSSIVGKGEGRPVAAPSVQVPDAPLVERRNSEPLIAATAAPERPVESLLAGLENLKSAAGERPLAANVSANIPIVLRTAAVTEQVKTLKCNECGAMNYPTEWYCERCGAELAAL